MSNKIFSLLMLFLISTSHITSQVINRKVEDNIQIFDAWIESKLEFEKWPGLIVGIVYDQNLIWSKAYGYADLESKSLLDKSTIFPIGSNTKMFTAIAVLKLRDEGRLSLDDPVIKYLPWFERINNNNLDPERITIRHLLIHTSGLPREMNMNYWTDAKFPSSSEIVDGIGKLEIHSLTDASWEYSNLGIAIVGSIISSLSGMPYTEYIRTNILDPLGMNHTVFNLEEVRGLNFASGYSILMPDRVRRKLNHNEYKAFTAAAGMNSNLVDLSKFAAWIFRIRETNTTEIINGATLREMQHVYWVDDSWDYGLGLGFFIYHMEPNDMIGHGGHVRGFRTDFTIIPKDKIAMITLTNTEDIQVYPDILGSVSNMMSKLILPEIRKSTKKIRENINADSSFKKYVGTYRFIGGDKRLLIYRGSLVLINPKSDNLQNTIVQLQQIKKNIFRITTEMDNSYDGEYVIFNEDNNGNITSMEMVANKYEKVE